MSETLTPDEDRAWALLGGLMTWVPAAVDARMAQSSTAHSSTAQSSPASHLEYGILRWLSLTEARSLHMSVLADSVNVTPSHLSRIVARLEKRGWLSRSPDPDDGRYTLATLTPAGAEVVADTAPAFAEALRRVVLDHLDEAQVVALGDIAEDLLKPLKPVCVDGARQAFPDATWRD